MNEISNRVVELDKERMRAMVDKDIAKLNDMLCADLTYVHSTSRRETKNEMLDNLDREAIVYKSMKTYDVEARDVGDAVVIVGKAEVSVLANGEPREFSVRYLDVWQNQNGTWRMVAWQSTLLPD